jgi:cyclophilin family peptidyl-prolyl cis-trans isomerase
LWLSGRRIFGLQICKPVFKFFVKTGFLFLQRIFAAPFLQPFPAISFLLLLFLVLFSILNKKAYCSIRLLEAWDDHFSYGVRMRFLISFLFIIVIGAIIGCSRKAAEGQASKNQSTQSADKMEMNKTLTAAEIAAFVEKAKTAPAVEVASDEVGVIETDLGRIVLELFPSMAPEHCRNFKKLAGIGFYDGVPFHRVVPGFVIQGGDILSRDADRSNDGTGDPGYMLPAEFSDLPHERGTLSMARKGYNVNTAGSQFFICVAPAPQLNGQYTIFGRVLEGMEVVDQIVAISGTDQVKQTPDSPVVMNKVRVVKRNEL